MFNALKSIIITINLELLCARVFKECRQLGSSLVHI